MVFTLTRPSTARPSEVTRPPHQLASLAVRALLDETNLSPKPGLVDPRGSGAHHDMDWAMLCRSARALQPSFLAMAQAAQQAHTLDQLRNEIGHLGRAAEATMLSTTQGVNTHRGAIWALGLLVSAAARWPQASLKQIAQGAGYLAQLPDRALATPPPHPGLLACRTYGVGGARAQAMAGFPQVMQAGLPQLQRSRQAGASPMHAQLNALLAIMQQLDDTCLLARGGLHALQQVQQGAAAVLAAGGAASTAGQAALATLDQLMQQQGWSPGGAADLLAATLFLDSLARPSSH